MTTAERGRHSLLQPRWIVAHLVILAVVVTFPQLGLWQLRRWDQERAEAQRLAERLTETPAALLDVLRPEMTAEEIDDAEFRPVTVTGTYRADAEVAQRSRSYGSRNGFDLLTPLDLGDGRTVLVRRGWVPPTSPAAREPTAAPAPAGEVTVRGYLERSTTPPGFGPQDPPDGTLTLVFHADLDRLAGQLPGTVLPMLVHLTEQDPEPGELPLPQPAPEIDASQNISYALQWFAFTVIAIVGYAIVLRRRMRGLDGSASR